MAGCAASTGLAAAILAMNSSTVSTHAIERDPGDPKIIKTVWGGGYVFTPAVTHE